MLYLLWPWKINLAGDTWVHFEVAVRGLWQSQTPTSTDLEMAQICDIINQRLSKNTWLHQSYLHAFNATQRWPEQLKEKRGFGIVIEWADKGKPTIFCVHIWLTTGYVKRSMILFRIMIKFEIEIKFMAIIVQNRTKLNSHNFSFFLRIYSQKVGNGIISCVTGEGEKCQAMKYDSLSVFVVVYLLKIIAHGCIRWQQAASDVPGKTKTKRFFFFDWARFCTHRPNWCMIEDHPMQFENRVLHDILPELL